MKTKKLYIPVLAILVVFMLFSCSSENDEPKDYVKGNHKVRNGHRVSMAEAIRMSERLILSLESVQVRAGLSTKQIKSVEVYGGQNQTKSVGDTLFYLINYADNGGFALMAADDRCLPVYAISESGNLSLKDTVFNPGLAMVLTMAENDVKRMTSSDIIVGENWNIVDFSMDRKISPHLSVYQSRIRQTYPWNKYCFCADGERSVAGCVAVSVEQLCSFFGHPTSINGYSVDWSAINDGDDDDSAARFIAEIGRPTYLDMQYFNYLTAGCYMDSVAPTLRKMGFNVGNKIPFNERKAALQLRSQPIIVAGSMSETETEEGILGHCFIVDGLIQYGELHRFDENDLFHNYLPAFYFHCVWGNGGYGNGYFYFAKNHTFGGQGVEVDENDFYNYHNYIYDKNIEMIPTITLNN